MEQIMTLVKKHSDWQQALEKRHHKFVKALIQYDYDVEKVAEHFRYSRNDILSIFKRIEKRLLAFDHYKEQMEKQKSYHEFLNSLNEPVRNIFKEVIKESEAISIKKIFPPKLAQYIETTLVTKNLEKTAELHGVNASYIIQRLVGRKKPRKPCEKGALHYLHQAK